MVSAHQVFFVFVIIHNNNREWPQPVLLKKMDEDVLGLGLQVWDPRVSFTPILVKSRYHVIVIRSIQLTLIISCQSLLRLILSKTQLLM